MLKDNIRKFRKRAGLTQRALAELSGVSYSTITKLENGILKNPSTGVLACIAIVLYIDIEDLIGLEKNQNPFAAIDKENLRYLAGKGFNETTWTPANSTREKEKELITLTRYTVRDELLKIYGYELKYLPDDAYLILVDEDGEYEITEDDLNDLEGSTFDFFEYKLQAILKKSRCIKKKD